MKRSELGFYISRKMGKGMSHAYKASAFAPAVLIALVSFILNFSLIFILSMSSGINNLLINLGSGDIRISGEYYGSAEGDKHFVKEASALAFSENGSAPLYLKGVDYETYFTDERLSLLHIGKISTSESLNPVIISSKLSKSLGLDVGDRFSALVYDESMKRTRPVLLTVSSVFYSGYAEFDSAMCYVPVSLLSFAKGNTELLLNPGADEEHALRQIGSEGYDALSYKSIYSAILSNVELSISMLYLVFIVLALLASFFSGNISFNYIERDRKDIAGLYLSGLGSREIKALYMRITMSAVLCAILSGLALALMLSAFTPALLSLLSRQGFSALDAYLVSFDISIPFLRLAAVNIFLSFFSAISLSIALRAVRKISLIDLLSSE